MKSAKIIIFLLALIPIAAYAGNPSVYPNRVTFNLILNEQPANDVFTTYVVFQEYHENTVDIAFSFTKIANLQYEAVLNSSTQTELDKFYFMCTEGNRGYWDEMHLENKSGTTSLSIKHIFFEVRYNAGQGNRTIPILDWEVNRVLPAGNSVIDLNSYAVSSRAKWVIAEVKRITGIDYIYDINTEPSFLAAIRDMGKCGTAGPGDDEYGDNPKYSIANALCSEFTSWYYANEGTPLGKKIFRDISSHGSLINVFANNDRRYNYNIVTKQFEHSVTGEAYHPQPGDYIRRDDVPGDGHSMIIAGWNEETNIAAVVNGPWPVNIRQVNVDALQSGNHEMQVGRVNEMIVPDYINVYFRDEAVGEGNIVKPRIYLENISGEPVSDVVCYFNFTIEPGKNIIVEKYYIPSATVSLEQISSTLYRIKYDYTGVTIPAGAIMPSDAGNVIGIHYSDWSSWDKNDDPSYINTSSFVVNDNIPVYNTNGHIIN